jgi:hypothetical protein
MKISSAASDYGRTQGFASEPVKSCKQCSDHVAIVRIVDLRPIQGEVSHAALINTQEDRRGGRCLVHLLFSLSIMFHRKVASDYPDW